MIQLPKRSVTRFFIPLIDVLTLLFCIFLLMPIFGETEQEGREEEETPAVSDTAQLDLEIARLKRELNAARERAAELGKQPTGKERQDLQDLRAEVARLREQQKGRLTERNAIFVLRIDNRNGQLFYYDPADPDRKVVIDSAAKARALIEQHRGEAGTKRPYFLIQLPRVGSYPKEEQYDMYRSWFQSVPHGFTVLGGK